MSEINNQTIQKIVHAELKKISEQLDRIEHLFSDFEKAVRYDIAWIKEHLPTKENKEQGRRNANGITLDESQVPSFIHQELHRVIENNLAPLMERIIHEEVKIIKEDLDYIKKHYPSIDALHRTAEELHAGIVKSIAPKDKKLPPPLPHIPQI